MSHQALKLLVITMGFIIILMTGLLVGLLLFKHGDSDITQVPAFGMEELSSADMKPRAEQSLYAINLFASWCKPCKAEMPHIAALSKAMNVYGIAVKDEPEKTKTFLKDNGNPYAKVGYDHAGIMPDSLGASGVPATLIVNSEGAILYRFPGALNAQIIQQNILPLMDGPN